MYKKMCCAIMGISTKRKRVAFMEKQSRKQNRLENYDYSQNGAYFVTICTQDRKPVLGAIVGDGFPVPKPIGEIAEEYIRRISEKYPDVTVDQYVIMPDHIHILLRIDGTGNPSPTNGYAAASSIFKKP